MHAINGGYGGFYGTCTARSGYAIVQHNILGNDFRLVNKPERAAVDVDCLVNLQIPVVHREICAVFVQGLVNDKLTVIFKVAAAVDIGRLEHLDGARIRHIMIGLEGPADSHSSRIGKNAASVDVI